MTAYNPGYIVQPFKRGGPHVYAGPIPEWFARPWTYPQDCERRRVERSDTARFVCDPYVREDRA